MTSCIVCKKELRDLSSDTGEDSVHPVDGLHFRTYGHYGSTVFDPMDGTYLDIVVCDECILANTTLVSGTGEVT
jgi:hypothetical protein